MLAQRLDGLRDGRALLADGHVDALHALTLLVQDRVDRDRRLAGLAVADDQLALAPADRRHRVDGLDAGLQRLVHGLATGDAGRLDLEAAQLVLGDRAVAVDRDSERVHHSAEQRVADRDREDAAGRGDELALLHLVGLAEHDRADVVFLEVQREAERAAFELEQLVDRRVGETRDARDAVADLEHSPDLLALDRRTEALDALAQRPPRCRPRRWSALPFTCCSFNWSRR